MTYIFYTQAEFAENREGIRALLREYCVENSELLYISLNEAINNAFIHGYRNCTDCTPVELEVYKKDDELVIKIRTEAVGDQHQRFKPKNPSDEDDLPELLSEGGRGLFIIANCTDYCGFNEAGTEFTMRKKIKNI